MAAEVTGANASDVEAASALLATDPSAARARAQAILKARPNDPRAALILASARRRLGDAAGAHALLAPLARAFPNAALTQYELGLALSALHRPAEAAQALRRAVQVRNDLVDAWRALGEALFLEGDSAGADAAFAGQAVAALSDPELKAGAQAMFAGRLAEAEARVRARLAKRPDDPDALRLLADACARMGRDGEAELLLARCLELDPEFDGARFDYANVLFRRQDGEGALANLAPLMARDPDHPAYRNLRAACLGLVGAHDEAIAIYRSLLNTYERQPKLWLNLGHALRTVGQAEEAAAAYRRAIALSPTLGEAYWSLANLKTAAFLAGEAEAMTAALTRSDLAEDDRVHLHYALGKALEDGGDAEAAFANYASGARLKRTALAYDFAVEAKRAERTARLMTRAFFAERAGFGFADPAPIFIVGLPRSGSTLVEQILASHPAVEGTSELPDIALLAASAGPAYPEALADLDAAAFSSLGARYIERTGIHRRLARPRFIDKMPNNFQHVGFIHLILPHARIIDARRHPMATGFSAFKQLFHRGQAFSYDLADLGRYYRAYVALMRHFDEALPSRIHRVIYEDLIDDTEAEVRRLLTYLELPFDPACLEFHRTARPVRTVSSEQVRRPVYREGLDHWRRFERQLQPLAEALGPTLTDWRD